MLWVDKHRPTSLDKMSYHVALSERLNRLVSASPCSVSPCRRVVVDGDGLSCQGESADLPHMLFYGPAGAGKKTRIMALLRKVFGPGVEKVRPWLAAAASGMPSFDVFGACSCCR